MGSEAGAMHIVSYNTTYYMVTGMTRKAMFMAYKHPRHVDAPRRRWRLIDILHNGGDGDAALVIGDWDGRKVLAARWNGSSADTGIGNPQSRGIPTWFILPEWLNEAALTSDAVPRSKVRLAKELLGLN
jgi:hypothetical protein